MFKRKREICFLYILIFLIILIPTVSASIDHVIISEFFPDTYTYRDADEYIAIFNPTENPIDISGWKISDTEANITFPKGSLIAENQKLYITKNAVSFKKENQITPDFEYGETNLNITQMAGGKLQLRNAGDELLLSDIEGNLIDVVIYGDSSYAGEGWLGSTIGKAYEGVIFERDNINEIETRYDTDLLSDTNSKKDWDDLRTYRLGQSHLPLASFNFTGTVHVFTSPDSSYKKVTEAIDSANNSIYLCSYEFDNQEIAKHIINAIRRGVDVKILLEGDPVDEISEESNFITNEIAKAGGKVYFMIENETVHDRYRYIHAKYMLIDNKKTLITTENFKLTGIPKDNSFGNRGWGLIIEDVNVTSYFLNVFEDDCGGRDIFSEKPKEFTVGKKVEEVQKGNYDASFSSKKIYGNFEVIPVIAPDTSLKNETVLGLLNSAKSSIYIEQNYIHKKWDYGPNLYLEAVIDAARRGVEVRILLDKSWYNTKSNSEIISYINQLAEDEELDIEARFLREDLHVDKLHTKGVIVDQNITFISSINWNENSPTQNREVGVILVNHEVANYFTEIFINDWGENGDGDWDGIEGGDRPVSVIIALVVVIIVVSIALLAIKRYLE